MTNILDEIRSNPGRFDFFQAVRLLDRMRSSGSVRFRADLSLRFPGQTITAVEDRNGQDLMSVAFLGLVGPSGVMPDHYSAALIDRTRDKDTGTRDFLDMFNNRIIALFYEAAVKHHPALAFERARRAPAKRGEAPREDLLTRCVRGLVGLGTAGLENRLACGDARVLFYSGHYAKQPRCAVSLELLIAETFGTDAQIEQFQPRWIDLGPENCTSMPQRGDRGPRNNPRNNALGSQTICGSRVRDVQSRFRVRLGSMTFEQYLRFTPDGDFLPQLWDLVRLYAGAEFEFDARPVLRAEDVPDCILGSKANGGPRLGRTVWLKSRPFDRDFDGAAFEMYRGDPYIN